MSDNKTTAVGVVPMCGYCGRQVRGSDLCHIDGSPTPYHIARTAAELEAENAMLREQLAWCMPRLSRQRYRDALIAFLAQRGITMVPPARDRVHRLLYPVGDQK